MTWFNLYLIDAIDGSITSDTMVDLTTSSYCDAGPSMSSVTVVNQIDFELLPINDVLDTSGGVIAIRWLVARGADPSLAHDFGGAGHGKGATALHLAAQLGDLATMEVLLECGADPAVKDVAWSGTPRDWAEACDQPAAAAWLAARGAR